MYAYLIDNAKYVAVFMGFLFGLPIVIKRRGSLGLKNRWQAALSCTAFSPLSVLSAVLFAGFESLIGGKGFVLSAISTYGIYFICPPLIMLASKLLGADKRKMMDVYTLYALPSLFFLRINCLISDCCGGRMIGATGLYWPTRQAEMIFYSVMLVVLLRRERKGATPGSGFPFLMAAYGAFRFIEEWFREASGENLLHLAHGWSIIALIIGLGLYFELSKNPKKGKACGERSASKC